jgi:hypothetical protein
MRPPGACINAPAHAADSVGSIDVHDRADETVVEAGGRPIACRLATARSFEKGALVGTFDTTRNDYPRADIRATIEKLGATYPTVLLFRADDKQPIMYDLPDEWSKSAKSRKKLSRDLLSFFRKHTRGSREEAKELCSA